MAPSPENDSAPKAPDKTGVKSKNDGQENIQKECASTEGDSKEASVSTLDDRELKALLDEAITYKSPKDRQGKSILFNNLLTEAEDDLRNARATSASGPQLARYYNQSASKRHRNRRQASSVSENLTHGGSLNNLAKEELYEAASIHLQKPKKTVSSRQREGGSLPCNVNVGASYDRQFFEEARKKEKEKSKVIYSTDMDIDRTLQHELHTTSEMDEPYTRLPSKYLKNVKHHEPPISTPSCMIPTIDKGPKIIDNDYPKGINYNNYESFTKLNGTLNVFSCSRSSDKKVVDENCNALSQAQNQKKKIKKKPMEKNVNVFKANDITGHRGDIINDVDKLIDFIDGNDIYGNQKSKSSVQKSQKIHKNFFDEGKTTRKQRTRSKGKGNNLQKSNSLEEMSTTKLEDFEFLQEDGKVALRPTKSNADKPRERRSWGNSDQIQVQSLYNVSVENLETSDFRVVTKKKKSKKRRSSLSSRRQTYSREEHVGDFTRVTSPEPRRKSAISVPHSEKSNDSSDVDSVHSLPIDANHINREDEDNINFPISYADIAKNNSLERPKWTKGNNEKKSKDKKQIEKNIPTSPDSDSSKTEISLEKIVKKKPLEEKNKAPLKQITIPPQQPQQISPKSQEKSPIPEDKPLQIKNNQQAQPGEMNLVNYMANFPSIPSKEKNVIEQHKPIKNIVAEIQNWPAIPSNNFNNKIFDKNLNKATNQSQNQQKSQKNLTNHFKNAKNANTLHIKHEKEQNIGINNNKPQNIIYNNDIQVPINAIYTHQNMPINIQDVRTIEKHFKNNPSTKPIFFHNQFFCPLQRFPVEENSTQPVQVQQLTPPPPPLTPTYKEASPPPAIYDEVTTVVVNNNINSNNNVLCDTEYTVVNNNVVASNSNSSSSSNNSISGNNNNVNNSDRGCSGSDVVVSADGNTDCDRTTTNNNNNNRPAVVILSGNSDKDVSGITFGFDINEQLLSDDVCADFLARFVPPKDCEVTNGFNLDKIVNFIGVAWEDIIRETNGSVKYYTEEL